MDNLISVILIIGLVYTSLQQKTEPTRNMMLIITGLLAFCMFGRKVEGYCTIPADLINRTEGGYCTTGRSYDPVQFDGALDGGAYENTAETGDGGLRCPTVDDPSRPTLNSLDVFKNFNLISPQCTTTISASN